MHQTVYHVKKPWDSKREILNVHISRAHAGGAGADEAEKGPLEMFTQQFRLS